jgi:subtilase family serine protease
LGAENAAKTIDVAIWLQPHNRTELDALARDLYNPASASYRQWLTASEIVARFAPTAEEAKTVQEFVASKKLKVLSVDPNNFYVRARGTVATVETAFHVKLNNYQVGGQTLRSNASDPYIDGPAAALVQAVSGLDSGTFAHPLDVRPTSLPPASGGFSSRHDLSQSAAAANSDLDTVCFTGPRTEEHTTYGGYPKATYKGNGYATSSTVLGCGYAPANLYAAYNLNSLYAAGFNGAGQTIVIIDWCGSPTILNDANVFSKKFGLPKLSASNFSIINYPGPSDCAGVTPEINLDVEWAHAIAPGANIDLVVPPTADFEDVDEAIYYAATSGLGNTISGSYASPEFLTPDTEMSKENLISELAAVAGVATNFASGDEGNWGAVFLPPTVSVPANLPYATGVGGVSLALNSNNAIAFQTGWATHESILIQGGIIYDPPRNLNFTGYGGGSGGGASAFFAKPAFQKNLPGKYRQVPDIAWLADPFTGVPIVISQTGQLPTQLWYVIGGTSLSTPMFSALWAIANQEAGTALGQAAPYLYSMPSSTVSDIVPRSSADDTTAVIEESSAVTHRYNTAQTLEVVPSLFGSFYSTIWDDPAAANTSLDVSFGEDYYLKAKVGWDDMTGLGTPNAKAFADWFAPAKK